MTAEGGLILYNLHSYKLYNLLCDKLYNLPVHYLTMTSHDTATPLLSLDAVAFDTETTGLEVAKARVIELAAVRIVGGLADENQTFARLINPGVAIPDSSRAIHGISDDDVADAGEFSRS